MTVPINAKADAVSKEAIYSLFDTYQTEQIKALFSICYLGGLRISEALTIRRKDFTEKEFDFKGKKVMITTLYVINKKNKINPYKTIPLIPINQDEKRMLDYVMSYKNKFIDAQQIFNMDRLQAHDLMSKQTVRAKMYRFSRHCRECESLLFRVGKEWRCGVHGIRTDSKKVNLHQITYKRIDYEDYYHFNPHFARDCRAEHIADMGTDLIDMLAFFGWASPKPAMYYLKKREWSRPAMKMLEKSELS
jgi:integrase